MPAVLVIEALAQLASILAYKSTGHTPDDGTLIFFAGIDDARFRRQVRPGDQLVLEAEGAEARSRHRQSSRRGPRSTARSSPEANLLAAMRVPGAAAKAPRPKAPRCRAFIPRRSSIRRRARRRRGRGRVFHRRSSRAHRRGTVVGPHVVLTGRTAVGKRNRLFQFTSIGEIAQDRKYGGEPTTTTIGDDNVFREFMTINAGTAQDRGDTKIGNGNLFLAYTHVAHDCVVGQQHDVSRTMRSSRGTCTSTTGS
jgi:hypothetical protein